jgi:hypothetical protein
MCGLLCRGAHTNHKGINMSQDNPKRVVRFDHNYKNRSPIHEISEDIANELQSLKKAYRRLKDKFADNVDFNLELLQEDLEDVRVSTRVADRFKNLQYAMDKTEIAKDTLNALKPLAYTHQPNRKPNEYQIERFRKEFGSEVADYEVEYVINKEEK